MLKIGMKSCIFCELINGKVGAVKIYEDDKFFAFLDAKPLNPGHTLLIPKRHVDYIFDMEEPLYSEIFKMAKKLSRPIQAATQAKKIGLSIEGFGVAHTHVHLIPIYKGHEMDPGRAKPATEKELQETAEKIKASLNLCGIV